MYPQYIVDEIRQKLPVSQLVGRYVALRRHGREFSGLCPFHKEKTPSFTVNDEKGFYHCFGCGQHGDIFNFVKEYERVSYREAIERLAPQAGVALPPPDTKWEKEEKKRQDIYQVMEMACGWFESRLLAEEGHAARRYIEERGLNEAVVGRYRLGFAPDSSDAMIRALQSRGVSEQQMDEAGLIARPQGRGAYARFRGRLIFPIRDVSSKVVAFGGRILPGMGHVDAAKYLNSPETDCFKKGQMLFNYDLARRPATQSNQLIVCEGYMDVIALAQAGIEVAVAPLGTAITREQLLQMWRVCDAPALCLDGDAAGARAMQRALELALPMLAPGKTLTFVRLPAGEDPDSLVRRQGPQALLSLVTAAPSLTEVMWRQIEEEAVRVPELRAGQEQKLMQLTDKIEHPIVKSHVKSFFRDRLWQSNAKGRNTKNTPKKHAAGHEVHGAATLPVLPTVQDTAGHKERTVLAALCWAMRCPALLADPQREEQLACALIADVAAHQLRQQLLKVAGKEEGIDKDESVDNVAWLASLEPDQHAHAHLLMDKYAPLPHGSAPRDVARLAQAGWLMAIGSLHLIELKEEYARLSQALAGQGSEEIFEQMQAIGKQIQDQEQQQAYLMQQQMDADA